MDEISPHAATRVTALDQGRIEEFEVAPEDFGIARSAKGAVQGGDASENARVLWQVLSGEPHPSTDAFVLNAAAALVVAEGIEPKLAGAKARDALGSGAALRTLKRFRKVALAAREKV
jgi:anthranilate phosphoribosyltransferase